MLSEKDYRKIEKLDERCGWGISYEMMRRFVREHKNGDAHAKEFIEERLDDCNFHLEAELLRNGAYAALKHVNYECYGKGRDATEKELKEEAERLNGELRKLA